MPSPSGGFGRRIARRMDELLLEAAERCGLSGAASLRDLLGDDPDWVTEEDHFALWTAMMRQTGDAGLPVRIGQAIPADGFALLGMACKTAPTVAAALERFARYLRLWDEIYEVRLDALSDGGVRVVLQRGPDGGLGGRCGQEAAVVKLVQAARELTDGLEIARVCFRHPAPGDRRAHEVFFAVPVCFGERFDGIELPSAVLGAPLKLSDASISSYLGEQLARLAARTRPRLAVRLERAITERLAHGPPTLGQVASDLGLAPRTLQRRLAELETSLTAEVDRIRRRRACAQLVETDAPIASIALGLGFAEPSTFHRAFRRWASQTPSQYRQAARAS